MNQQPIHLPDFVTGVLEHLIIRGRLLPHGLGGLAKTEVDFFNYFLHNQGKLNKALVKSQLLQDLWVTFLLDAWNEQSPFNSAGYFVEFGALDGLTFSNTFLLEKQFQWTGILAEPAPIQVQKCRQCRSVNVDDRCVWTRSGERLEFNQVVGHEELATIDSYTDKDMHNELRTSAKTIIAVETVSLVDLLRHHDAPRVIDYMSIDTEGSEFDILQAFDFDEYAFRTLTVEHNFTDQRKPIHELLTSKGYEFLPRSVQRFDDLFFKPGLVFRDL